MKKLYNILQNKSGQYLLHKQLILMEIVSWMSVGLIFILLYLTIFQSVQYFWFIVLFGCLIIYMEYLAKRMIYDLVLKNKDRLMKELDEVFKDEK